MASADQHVLGQYFTTDSGLKNAVLGFIRNSPEYILEPSVGRGDLVLHIATAKPDVTFDMVEIDPDIHMLPGIHRPSVVFTDFLGARIGKKYVTIVGNPPYVRTTKGNLYLDFVAKCVDMLVPEGELIFIVPSDFFRVTCAANLIQSMMVNGTFTDIYHPHNEKLFANASIDVLVFRYCKNPSLPHITNYNGKPKYLVHNRGMIIFSDTPGTGSEATLSQPLLGNSFGVYVGLVTGMESVFKHPELGNIDVLVAEGKKERYILLETYPSGNTALDNYMLTHKDALLSRTIRKFNGDNWYQWGALRNIQTVRENMGKPCIYVSTITRKQRVAHVGTVCYFSATMLMLLPLSSNLKGEALLTYLDGVAEYFNSQAFRESFTASGRFKIGQGQLVKTQLPIAAPPPPLVATTTSTPQL